VLAIVYGGGRVVADFSNFGNLAASGKAAASHATDFEPPIYNVWIVICALHATA